MASIQVRKYSCFYLDSIWRFITAFCAGLLFIFVSQNAFAQASFNSSSATTAGGQVAIGGTLSAGITYGANAVGLDSINKIELREGDTVLNSVPYVVVFKAGDPVNTGRQGTLSANLGIGTHVIYLRGYTYEGFQGDSPSYTVTVTGPSNVAPMATLTAPGNGATFTTAGTTANVTVSGFGSDSDGSVVTMEVLDNGSPVTSVNAASISVALNFAIGSHSIQVRATDNSGAATTSAAVSITVSASNAAPSATLNTPGNGATFVAAANGQALVNISGTSSDDQQVSLLEILDNGTPISSVSGISTTLSINTSVALGTGAHAISLRATDNQSVTGLSAVANITVTGNSAPTANISSPLTNARYVLTTGTTASVTVVGAGSDADGSVTQLELLDGASVIATVSAASINVPVNLAIGTHTLQLRATDNALATGLSNAVTVIVANNTPPTVSITAPTNGAVFSTTASPLLTASATDSDGTIASVAFYHGGVLIGTATSSPYSYIWNNAPVGVYSITAVATDDLGAQTTSSPISMTVGTPGSSDINYIAVQATTTGGVAGAGGTLNAGISYTVNATSGTDSVNKVELREGNTVLDSISYTVTYKFGEPVNTTRNNARYANFAVGTHQIYLRSYTIGGLQGDSPVYTVTVTAPSNVPAITLSGPGNGSVYNVSDVINFSATATGAGSATISNVQFFNGGTSIGVVTTSPYNFSWVTPPIGNYSVTAVATDNLGVQGTSIAVTGRVNAPPTITLSAPAQATPTGGIAVTANASDSDGVVQKVEFYGDGNLLATVTQAPYTFTWTSPALGNHNVVAKAYDNNNAVSTSNTAMVSVVSAVGNPPTAILNITPTNFRIAPGSTTNIVIKGTGTDDQQVVKLELFKDTGSGYDATPIQTATGTTASLTLNYTYAAPTGTYRFKLRSTDNSNNVTDSVPVIVNVTDSTLLGAVSGVRSNAANVPILYGWACQDTVAQALNFQVYVNAPASLGGALIGAGTAGVATEVDNIAVQTQCHTAGSAHHFNFDLSSFTSQYPGAALYVQVQSTMGATTVLPCSDGLCNMPGSLRIAMATPANGDHYPGPANVFMQAKLLNGSAPYDEVAFNINDEWITAAVDSTDATGNTYFASKAALPSSATPYVVYAKVRKGSSTLFSVQNLIYVDANNGASVTVSAPASGATLNIASTIPLTATVSLPQGSSASVASVKFYANGQLIATASNTNALWTASWKSTQVGAFAVTARAFDGVGNQLAQSTSTSVTLVSSAGASPADPIAVTIAPPHLANTDAGSLPGNLAVGNDGAATYSIPLAIPPGTGGLSPNLSLNYSSLGSNGMVGLGWSLGGLSTIHRCNKTIVQDIDSGRISFDHGDRLCLDGQRLIRVNGTLPSPNTTAYDDFYWNWTSTAEYRTEQESFSRITTVAGGGFKLESKDGRIHLFGTDTNSAIAAQGRSDGQPLLWALKSTQDRSGNVMTVEYNQDATTGEYTPKQIRYGANSTANQTSDLAVKFSYEARPDAQVQYMGGSHNDLINRLTHVQTFIGTDAGGNGGTLVRDHTLHYTISTNSGRSMVDWMQACAINPVTSTNECLPKTTFDWGAAAPAYVQKPSIALPYFPTATLGEKRVQGNLDGSGKPSFMIANYVAKCNGGQQLDCSGSQDPEFTKKWPVFNGQLRIRLPNDTISDLTLSFATDANLVTDYALADLDGDGRDDLILESRIPGMPAMVGYCLNTPGSGGLPNFVCTQRSISMSGNSSESGLPTIVDLRNDRQMHLNFGINYPGTGTSGTMVDCSYHASSGVQCQNLSIVDNTPQTPPYVSLLGYAYFRPAGIDLSKQDVSDFFSIWQNSNYSSRSYEGVTVCFNKKSIQCQSAYVASSPIGTGGATLPPLQGVSGVGDINGDGLTDFVFTVGGAPWTCLSKETAYDCKPTPANSGSTVVTRHLGDYTGDGVARIVGDLVPNYPDYTGATTQLCRWTNGVYTCQAVPNNHASLSLIGQFDLDGSGVPSFVFRDPAAGSNAGLVYSLAVPASQDRIIGVTNGVGQREEVDYARGDDSTVFSTFTHVNGVEQKPTYPQILRPAGVMAKQLRRSNGQGNWIKNNYYYEGALSDATGRGSLGFGLVQVTDVQNNIVKTSYLTQGYPYTGMLNRSVTVHGSAVLEDTVNILSNLIVPQANGNNTIFAYISQTNTTKKDLDGSDLGSSVTVNVYKDLWGNLNNQKITASGAGKTFASETIISYNNDKTSWLAGLPRKKTIKKTDPVSGTLARTTSYTYLAGTTLPQTETIEPHNTALKVVNTFDRTGNVFGLVNKKIQTWTDPYTAQSATRTESDTAYDPRGRFPQTIKNAAGHTETRTYYPGTGAQSSLTGPNGLTTTWQADGFGRVTKELRADGNETRSYRKQCQNDCPSYATVASITENFHGNDRVTVPQVSYSDSAGHTVRQMSWGFDGRSIVTDQRYDSQGRLSEVDQPRFINDSAHLSQRQYYDDLNRVTDLITLDENGAALTTHTTYQGLVNIITNPKSQTRTDTRDVLGRVINVIDAHGGNNNFGYDPFGNLISTIDPNGNLITVTYDALGRKTDLRDPDLGWTHYDVDPVGRTWKQTSPNQRALGKFTRIEFDAIDRMTARHESDLESRWTYDTAAKGIGQLAEAYTLTGSAKDYSRLHTYDSLGRPSRSSQLINSQVYSQTPDYDLWGRLIRTTYQRGSDSAKVYDTRYNNTGYLARTERGALILWQVTTQDAAQRPTSALLGNGLFDLRSYNVNTGRLDSGTVHSNGTPRLQESYQYDPLGNVTQRAQYWDSGSFNEGFSYDSLNRLSTSQVGGQALQTTSYDPAGNLSSKTGIGSYTYPSQGSSAIRPHAVQSTSSQGSFTYDNNGNLKTGAGRNLTWTSYDMPVQIQRGTITDNFVYGPEHQRVRQDRNDGSSLIYAGAQEIDTKGGTTIKTYWPGGIGVEIDKPGASNSELYWHHKDRLGSPIALSGSDGSLSEKLAYDAWGRRRTLDGSAPLDNSTSHLDNKGYTGHEMLDQVDLVHMNGRIYDPITARFLSGDPLIQDPINGQNYNRYSYVLNNPTNLTDPTGFAIATAESKTCAETPGANCGIISGERNPQGEANSGESKKGDANGRGNGNGNNNATNSVGVVEKVGKYLKGEWQQLKNNVNYDLDHPLEAVEKLTTPFGAGGMVAGSIGGAGKITGFFAKLFSGEKAVEEGAAAGTTFFRTMSKEHYEQLVATGKVPATAETFISPTKQFSQAYDGVLVQFNMKPGALSALESIGVRDASVLAKGTYGDMSLVSKGWSSSNAFFKAEGTQINIGLGKGTALETFNSYIKNFQVP
ncbi:Ig-like domain-containing protein [Undibacterium sp. Jales W-56]|uniref:Ig-like domain-containing protein n=1 Tax=Undibacterium sp. Jales W-56 TaxID=2897325 RepID=UPI0021D30F2C|nr:Ig-like domain-containing protein [Undibacterium sp. Jales W-56]MCU6433692.1 Ig-like domain-containing protein [Undibacterium sp. Jales W-56]